MTHGGARDGAGRKPAEPGGVDRAFRLYPRHLELIKRWQREHGVQSASEAVRQMLEASNMRTSKKKRTPNIRPVTD
jgi:hypothetical protein